MAFAENGMINMAEAQRIKHILSIHKNELLHVVASHTLNGQPVPVKAKAENFFRLRNRYLVSLWSCKRYSKSPTHVTYV